ERRIQHGAAERSPHIDDAKAMLQQFLRLCAEMITDAARSGVDRVIVVYLPRRRREPCPPRVAYIVVKDEHAAGTDFIAKQLLDFGVVGALDLLVVIEVCDRGRRLCEGKAVAVECKFGFPTARILDRDLSLVIDAVPLRHARRWIDAIKGRFFGTTL